MAVQAHYQGYLNALKSTDHATAESQRGPFMEFKPRDPATQSAQSAMSPSWKGVQSSEASIARGDYDLDFAPRPKSVAKAPASPEWNCSIQ
jgi:hypothetical protein